MKINYGEGIKIVRLFDGRILDIDEYKDDMDEDE